MKAIKGLLLIIGSIILIGCSDSKILEENTKDGALSKYKVTYKELSSEYLNLEDGYFFQPIYEMKNEFYGISKYYPEGFDSYNFESYLLNKIDSSGKVVSYENQAINDYLEDTQIEQKVILKDKFVYTKGGSGKKLNYYYSDFENEELKEISWLNDYYKLVEEKTKEIEVDGETLNYFPTEFEDNGFKITEYNRNGSYITGFDNENNNYKFISYVDLESGEFYISDIIEEEGSINYYYSYKEEAFIKINKDGSTNKLILKDGRIEVSDYELDLKEALSDISGDNNDFYSKMNLKDYSSLGFIDKDGLDNLLIINRRNNSYKLYKENIDLDKNYQGLSNYVLNSNYFFILGEDDKGYIGVVNTDLSLELIGQIDLNIDKYKEKGVFNFDIVGNKEGNKILITISGNEEVKDKNFYSIDSIHYILVDIK